MAESHVVSALAAKRAELAGEIQAAEKRVAQLRADLVHLDATLRLFDPQANPEAIPARRPYQRRRWFSDGELPRLILATLRTSSAPLSASMLAELIVAQKGFAAGDAHTFSGSVCRATYGGTVARWLNRPAARIGMLCGGCAALDYGKLHCPGGPTWLLLLRLERGCRMTGQEGNGMNLLLVGCTSIVMALGVGVYLGGSVGAQQLQYACDENGDGFVDATEFDMCTDREFDKLAVDKALTAEQLGALGQQRQPLSEVDANDDGEISREEWIGYVEEQFARATEGTGGRMSIEDYTKWREEGMPLE